jgi:K+-sensing histidine kinase KdpD
LVEMLDSSVSRLEKFALNALLITRLRTNPKISKNIIQLEKLVIEVLDELENKLKAQNLKILKTIQPEQISISGEVNLIKTCLMNILDNAIRYSPTDATIEVRCYIEDKYTICEVRDHGTGFSQEIIEHPFDLFITDNNYGDNQIGIELPIVKMVMDAHGGKAKISNSSSGGAIVRMEFI